MIVTWQTANIIWLLINLRFPRELVTVSGAYVMKFHSVPAEFAIRRTVVRFGWCRNFVEAWEGSKTKRIHKKSDEWKRILMLCYNVPLHTGWTGKLTGSITKPQLSSQCGCLGICMGVLLAHATRLFANLFSNSRLDPQWGLDSLTRGDFIAVEHLRLPYLEKLDSVYWSFPTYFIARSQRSPL